MCLRCATINPSRTRYEPVIDRWLVGEAGQPVTICYQFKLRAADGKMRISDVADHEQIFRIIQSVPSPKAEPFKQWMVMVAWEISCDFLRNPKKCSDFAGKRNALLWFWQFLCTNFLSCEICLNNINTFFSHQERYANEAIFSFVSKKNKNILK